MKWGGRPLPEGLPFTILIAHLVANVTGNAYNSSAACTNLNAGAYVANVYDGYNIFNNIYGYLLSVVSLLLRSFTICMHPVCMQIYSDKQFKSYRHPMCLCCWAAGA